MATLPIDHLDTIAASLKEGAAKLADHLRQQADIQHQNFAGRISLSWFWEIVWALFWENIQVCVRSATLATSGKSSRLKLDDSFQVTPSL